MTSGWIRLFGVFGCVVAVGAFVFVFNAEATVAFLYWIEYLSAMPGLSGAFLLVLAIVLFGGVTAETISPLTGDRSALLSSIAARTACTR